MTVPDDLVARGLSRHRAGDLDAADNLYRTALERDRGNSDAWHLLGVAAEPGTT
jgi:Tfp pilus assembly protein PilF